MSESSQLKALYAQAIAADADLPAGQKAILQAAFDLFYERGYAATTTADIAERAGMAQGSVYKRYKTKRALFDAVLAPFTTQAIPQAVSEFTMGELKAPAGTLREWVENVVGNRLDFVVANYPALRIMAPEVLGNPGLQKQLIAAILGPISAGLHHQLADLRDRGEIVPLPDDMILQLVSGTLASMAIRLITGTSTGDIAGQRRATLDFLVRGLTPAGNN